MSDTPDLIKRLRGASQGHDEWRAQNPEDACYCISFSRIDSLDPEREARSWLADHNKSFPQGPFLGYEVKCVRVLTDADRLRLEAADALEQQAHDKKVADDLDEGRERVIDRQKSIIYEQAAQIEALRADAARYAFIRARWTHCTFAWNKDSANSLKSIGLTIKTACPVKASSSSLDREIDAALRQEQPT